MTASEPLFSEGKGESILDRIELVRMLLQENTRLVAATTGFLNRPRDYTRGDVLYMREAHFLVAVGPDGHPTMSEMAKRLDVTQGAVTQTAIRLEKKGYVVRMKDADDKRLTTVSLTEKGKSVCMEHIAYDKSRYCEASEFLKEFSNEELERFIRFEQRLRTMFTSSK